MGFRFLTRPTVYSPIRQSLFNDLIAGIGDIYSRSLPYVSIANGDFSIDSDSDGTPDGWTFTPHSNGKIALTAITETDALVLYMKSPGGNFGGGIAETKDFIVSGSGAVINLKWWSKSSISTMRNQVEVVFYDENLNGFSSSVIYDDSTNNPTSWTLFARTFTTPALTRFIKVKLNGGVAGHETGGTVYFKSIDTFIPERIKNTTYTGGVGTFNPSQASIYAYTMCLFYPTLGYAQNFGTLTATAPGSSPIATYYYQKYSTAGTGIAYILTGQNAASNGHVSLIEYGAAK
jgi:hypothetical protein